MLWQRYPLFRIFLAFCAGILLANFFTLSVSYVQIALGVALILFLALSINYLFFKRLVRPVFGAATILFFLTLGCWSSQLYQRQAFTNSLSGFTQNGVYQIQLTQSPLDKGYAYRAEAKVTRLDSNSKLETKALLYLEKDTLAERVPKYGDTYFFKGRFKELQAPQNPYEFDYKNYLNLRSVYVSAYVSTENRSLHAVDTTSFLAQVKATRKVLLSNIDDWNLPPKQTQISKALLLGYRDEVDADLLKAYSAVGAMHVLAVSGLHIGIVYLVLAKLLWFLKSKRQLMLKSLLLIFALWGYACLTGLSPSVVRASTMFTFVAIGVSFRRQTSIYNTLLVSALFLLLIKPTYLFEVGFQLSYLAVFGIVWLQPKFERLLSPPTKLLQWIWSITTVSIAAQIATFPLGLYYFHQFPGLFLVSNLIVIPLVTVLMYVGLLILILSLFTTPFQWLLWYYSKLLWMMNNGVAAVEKWDVFLFQEIHISRLELVLFYLFLGFLFQFFFTQKFKHITASLLVLIGLQAYQLWENYTLATIPTLTVYRVQNSEALSFRTASKNYFVADTTLLSNDGKLTFHIKHHWWASNIKRQTNLPMHNFSHQNEHFLASDNTIQFENVRLVKNPVGAVQADYWYVSEPIEDELSSAPSQAIVLANTLASYHKEDWLNWAAKNKVRVHDPMEDGAIQLKLP